VQYHGSKLLESHLYTQIEKWRVNRHTGEIKMLVMATKASEESISMTYGTNDEAYAIANLMKAQ
jgi:hypothetical protein